jgi:glutaconate CoA-transferase subunit A
VIPSWAVTCVSEAPGGAKPSYAQGYYQRDNEGYRRWDEISREPDGFGQWLVEEIYQEERSRV